MKFQAVAETPVHQIVDDPDKEVSQQQQQHHRVRFQLRVDTSTLPSPMDGMESIADAKKTLWYDLSDIQAFRQEARILCNQLREIHILRTMNDNDNLVVHLEPQTQMAFDENTRGLELYSCLERKRRRHLAKKYILRAASELSYCEADKLASLSRELSTWASTLAIEEADRDYQHAWRTSSPHRQTTAKRSNQVEEDEVEDRRVRTRTLI